MINLVADLAIIGSGPAGFEAALSAAAEGLSVAVIEKGRWGGVCLNWGCVPFKAFLDIAHRTAEFPARRAMPPGEEVPAQIPAQPEIPAQTAQPARSGGENIAEEIRRRCAELVAAGRADILAAFERSGILAIEGRASIAGAGLLEIDYADGSRAELKAKAVLIAAGRGIPEASPGLLRAEQFPLSLAAIPESATILGGGATGLECADALASLGARVVVMEKEERILPGADAFLSRRLKKSLEKKGIDFLAGRAAPLEPLPQTDITLDARGSAPNYRSLFAESSWTRGNIPPGARDGEESLFDSDGRFATDGSGRTAVRGLYAAGDCTTGPCLATRASAEGRAVGKTIARDLAEGRASGTGAQKSRFPFCVYTKPQAAWTGTTEQDAEAAGITIIEGRSWAAANAAARIGGSEDGFVRLFFRAGEHNQAGKLLGAQILCDGAAELVALAEAAITSELGAEELSRLNAPHPSYAELIPAAARNALEAARRPVL